MPRYISKAPGYKKSVIKGENTLVTTPTGPRQEETVQPIIAEFSTGGITEYERQVAQDVFKFTGRGEEESWETTLRRISVYDTDHQALIHGWDDETKAKIEERLNDGQNSDYFRIDPLPAVKPWPAYDEFEDAQTIADFAKIGNFDYEQVRAYELENRNRPEVFAALDSTPKFASEDEIEA